MTWLIAEDEADIRNLVALMCQMWGHTTLTFENGQRVWDWLDGVESSQKSQANGEAKTTAEGQPAAEGEASAEKPPSAEGQAAAEKPPSAVQPPALSVQLPELILMDIRMPGKRGNELANRMRTIEGLKDKPIILMTAYTLNDEERKAMMAADGVDYILNKPLPDFEHLRTILHNMIDQKQATNDQSA